MRRRSRLQSGLSLGGEQAEADPLLDEAFVESSDYRVIASRGDPRCFVIGRTGVGKSAALQALEEREQGRVIRINPEDLSLPYITDLQVVRYLDALGVNLDLFWIALWKHVLLVEIIRHRYSVNDAASKQLFLQSLRQRISRDPAKRAALDYLDEFEGRFWCEADERVREITDGFASRFRTEGELNAGLPPVGGRIAHERVFEERGETRSQQVERYQRIVNETQLAKLNKMISVLDEEILDGQHFTYVVIDDLDRDWVDESVANALVRCLFRTVLDLKRVSNLKVLVALRTNIFQELDFGRRTGAQEEKLRALVLDLRWGSGELEFLLDQRVRLVAPTVDLEVSTFRELLPHANRTRGNPMDYVLERTLLRPRDAIAFANQCLRVGVGKARLSWDDIQNAERDYSANRLLALGDEWRATYPGIASVVSVFRNAPARIERPDFFARLDNVMLLPADPLFPGVRWVTDVSAAMWDPGERSEFEVYQPLLEVLFRIGLVGCSLRASAAPIFFSDDRLLLDSESRFEVITAFYIHRTYHSALDIRETSGARRP